MSAYGPLISYGENKFQEGEMFWGENEVFSIFSWQFIQGDPATALTEPNSVVITQSLANKYFGNEEAMGMTLIFENFGEKVPFKVTGVLKDPPNNSHFQFTGFLSFLTLEQFIGREQMMQNWGSNNYSTYVLLEEGHAIEELEAGIPGFLDKHLGENQNGTMASATNFLHFWPLTDIHLHSHLDSEIEANGDIKYVYTYSAIALFILLIACINFMNLSTARSMKRAKEVGVRKVMGAFRVSLIRQFMTESVVMALISAILALFFVALTLPWFNNFAGKKLSFFTIHPAFMLTLLLLIVIVVGFIAGSYPALYLSSFNPIKALKNNRLNISSKVNLRSVLVVFQFFISICLLIGVGVISDQIQFMKTKELGFEKENLVVLPPVNGAHEQFADFRNRLMMEPGISDVTLTSRVPSGRLLDSQGGEAEVNGEMRIIDFRIADIHVDHAYLETLGTQFLAGRNFNPELASDSTEAFVINKASVEGMGWVSPEAAIGKKFNYGGRKGYVIGVVDDFHFESLHQAIAPMVFLITTGRARNIIIKVKPGYEQETLAFLKQEWDHLGNGFPFDFYTVGDRFNEQYLAEEKLEELVNYFSDLAIFVAVLGLFGLSAFSVEQRLKEIGIRKVLGASVRNVTVLFGRQFALLVILGLVIAIPVSYFGMTEWLLEFPYRTGIKISTFVIAGLLALIFALATVSFEIIKAARMNPVDTLRNE